MLFRSHRALYLVARQVKTVRGGGISFRLTGQGQERFTRLRASTLGDGYDLQDVLAAIEGKEKRPGHSERKISLAVDIQAKLAAGKGPGYERWAKVFNIKQMAAALAYIQDNGLTDYEQLAQKATEAADRFHTISDRKSTRLNSSHRHTSRMPSSA